MVLSLNSIRTTRKLVNFFYLALPIIGFLLTLYGKGKQGIYQLLGTTLIAPPITYLTKLLIHITFFGKRRSSDGLSYSGYASSAVSAAAPIASFICPKYSRSIRMAPYVLICLEVGWRVAANSDDCYDAAAEAIIGTIVGAGVGMLTSYYFSRDQNKNFKKDSDADLSAITYVSKTDQAHRPEYC